MMSIIPKSITAKSVTITRNVTVLEQQRIQHNRVGKPGYIQSETQKRQEN